MVQTDLTSPDQPGEIFSLRRSRRTVVLLLLLSLAGSLSSEEVSERDSKQLLVRASPSSPGPPRRLLLPGRGNDQISRLNQGPLTLHNGRLRPVASIDRADRGADSLQLTEGRRRRPGRPGRPAPSTYFPQDNVPFSYNSKPVPEVFLTDFSDGPEPDQEASASEVILDWSTKVRLTTSVRKIMIK